MRRVTRGWEELQYLHTIILQSNVSIDLDSFSPATRTMTWFSALVLYNRSHFSSNRKHSIGDTSMQYCTHAHASFLRKCCHGFINLCKSSSTPSPRHPELNPAPPPTSPQYSLLSYTLPLSSILKWFTNFEPITTCNVGCRPHEG